LSGKRTFDDMVKLAYDLQNAIIALCGKRPLRITTNKDFKLLRVVWAQSFERKDWYDGVSMKILIDAFMDKHDIHVREITVEQDKESAVWLTKKTTDPVKKKLEKLKRW
jgi:hypothetical protein